MSEKKVKLIECPRDAMQGWKHMIAADKKAEYINTLLKVGFDTIDFGSFVSPKAIPQMADTKEVLRKLDLENTSSKLLAIVANTRGAEEAAAFDEITYVGYPFSVSQTFQQRNTNASIAESVQRVENIIEICSTRKKKLVIYISMGFGNPYNDPYSEEIVYEWVNALVNKGVKIISLADTVGLATSSQVFTITEYLIRLLPEIEIGVHLHSNSENRQEKLEAAIRAGCLRFDGALKGIGGCPMANDELVGNMSTEWMIDYFESKKIQLDLNKEALSECLTMAGEIFN